MKKQLVAKILVFSLALGLSAFGSSAEEVTDDSVQKNDVQEQQNTEESDAHILIAYFSRTGNTQEVAKEIQELTEGDMFEIETVDPYPDDYTETTEIAQEELNENARPQLSETVENIDQYDTIFLGYPIWWGNAPMAVYTFLESYDLLEKTIIPFCTSGGTQIEESIPMLEENFPDLTFTQGLTVNNTDEIQPWLEEIGMLEAADE